MNIIKKIKPFDCLVILIIIFALIVGYMTYKGKRATSSNQIEASVNIELEVYLRGVTSTDNEPLFKVGDETFITIRNVPYTKLKIDSFSFERRRKAISANNEDGLLIIEDPAMPFLYDFIINFEDNAKWTSDGYVVGGNKLKIGIPITIEGAKYRLNGTVTNIKSAEEIMQIEQNIQQMQQQEQQEQQ